MDAPTIDRWLDWTPQTPTQRGGKSSRSPFATFETSSPERVGGRHSGAFEPNVTTLPRHMEEPLPHSEESQCPSSSSSTGTSGTTQTPGTPKHGGSKSSNRSPTTSDACACSFITRMQAPATVQDLDRLCHRITAGRRYQGLSAEARRGCAASYRARRRQLESGEGGSP
jgi:hypothetical protein